MNSPYRTPKKGHSAGAGQRVRNPDPLLISVTNIIDRKSLITAHLVISCHRESYTLYIEKKKHLSRIETTRVPVSQGWTTRWN